MLESKRRLLLTMSAYSIRYSTPTISKSYDKMILLRDNQEIKHHPTQG